MQPNSDEIWIGVSGVKLKFGISEFGTITELKCFGNSDKKSCYKVENRFINSCFNGVNPVFQSSVKDCFFGKKWKCSGDAVKMAQLYQLQR